MGTGVISRATLVVRGSKSMTYIASMNLQAGFRGQGFRGLGLEGSSARGLLQPPPETRHLQPKAVKSRV